MANKHKKEGIADKPSDDLLVSG